MSFPILDVPSRDFFPALREIPQPPASLNYRGTLPPPHLTLLSVVGSRQYTSYGKQVVDELIGGLKGYPIGIVSGLALGIDSLAHEAALKNNLYTLAVPGGGLGDDVIYPASHKNLAYRILEAGGGLMSEYVPDFRATEWSFPKRNRIVAGVSRGTLLVEAAEKSGTLITARMTADYNRELMVVPGNIFSKTSAGIHQFLKLGATPVTCAKDILEVLQVAEMGVTETLPLPPLSTTEEKVISLLTEPRHRDELIRLLNMSTPEATQLLMMMELSGHISAHDNIYRPRL
ncbi:MAG: DNA-processing protein DprA [Candidatus Pacebacteria bacterium]|nr:DNA-processing protein DprA [Candidatus Paceibacterota bacterium]MBP9842944.1 DNA-processing protein DprA [Candidatus Paceibacterota bacterium]